MDAASKLREPCGQEVGDGLSGRHDTGCDDEASVASLRYACCLYMRESKIL